MTVAGGVVAGVEFGPASGRLDLLFLHANGFNALTYAQILAPLGDAMRVLAVDLRGHGLSRLDTPVDGHSWAVYAADLRALLAALGEVPRVLAGHSMGATTLLLALPCMDAPPPVVLFDPVLAPRGAYAAGVADWQTPIAQGAARRKDDFGGIDEAFGAYRGRGAFKTWPDQVLRDYLTDGLVAAAGGRVRLACSPAWEAANFAAYCVADPYPALDGARSRISIVRAAQDSTCSYAPGPADGLVTMQVVAGTTHFVPMERQDVVVGAVRGVA